MEAQTDNREIITGYVLTGLSICCVVLAQMRNLDVIPWLLLTCTANTAMIVSRLAREGTFGLEIQAKAATIPLWQIFGIGIALFVIEVMTTSYATTPGMSLIIRKIFGPLCMGIVFVGMETAIFRKTKIRSTASERAGPA